MLAPVTWVPSLEADAARRINPFYGINWGWMKQ
jgi:hypothetical protein